jgi:hypothetical protein
MEINYYRLLQDLDSLNVYIKKQSHYGGNESLKRGLIMPDDIDTTFHYTIEIEEDVDVPALPSYDSAGPIFDKGLIKTLERTGVDNLEIFPAIINNLKTGESIESYYAVNVVGLVSCADMDQSEAEPIADVHYFLDLKIDPDKTKGLLMFRLAEQPTDIIIHEKVAKAIREGSFSGIVLELIS